jgi:hypothetical protein
LLGSKFEAIVVYSMCMWTFAFVIVARQCTQECLTTAFNGDTTLTLCRNFYNVIPAGVLLLLAVQAGLVQLPQPQLPKLPGQQVVAKQLGRAGAAIKQRVLELDGDDNDSYSNTSNSYNRKLLPAALADGRQPWQQQQQQQRDAGEGSSSRGQQLQYKAAENNDDADREDDDLQQAAANSSSSSRQQVQTANEQQQQRQQQAPAPAVAASVEQQPAGAQAAFNALKGFGKRAAAATKGLAERAKEALPEQEELQAGLQAAGKGLGSAAQQLGSRVKDLGGRVQQAGLGDRVQGLKERAGVAAGAAVERVKGVREKVGSLAVGQAVLQDQEQQQQQQQQVQGAAFAEGNGSSSSGDSTGRDDAARVDSIIANS